MAKDNPYKKSEKIKALEKKISELPNSGSKEDSDKIQLLNKEYQEALKKDKADWKVKVEAKETKAKAEGYSSVADKEEKEKIERVEKNFKALQESSPGGKLSKDGKSYEIEGNKFNKDKTLVAENGNKGTWGTWGQGGNSFKVNIGSDFQASPSALKSLTTANEKYKTRRTGEIKAEAEIKTENERKQIGDFDSQVNHQAEIDEAIRKRDANLETISEDKSDTGNIPSRGGSVGSVGSSRGNTSNNNPINIQDLSEEITGTDETTTGAIKEGDSRQDIERRIQENKDLLNNLGNRPKFVHDYAPDQQQNTNLAGNIVDAGRGIMGMMGANTKVPVYQRGSMFQTSMDELSQRRNMGLTDTEKDYARNMAERGYGYDVKNIAKFAGGSAGVALGGLGRATGQLYDQYGQIAVRDEGVRRQNRADFNRGALSDEQVNRQIFTDELRQVEMTKQAGAALVQDATKNIRDRTQYEKAYGKGSQMYEYMKTLDRDKQKSMSDQEAADARRVEDIGKTAQTAIGDDEKLLQKYGTITPGTVLGGDPTETEGFKTVEELQKLKKEGKIDEDVYQEKLQQQPDDTTMPDDYKFPTNAFDPNSEKVETVRNVSNAPSTRADDYNQGIVGVDAKRPKSAIVDAVEAETTEVPDLATPGIVDEQEIPTEEVADDFVYPTAANPDPTNSNITEEVADVVDEDVESAPKVNPEWDAKYDKATEKEREKMLDEMPKEFDAASFSDETEPEDNIKDYEAELEQNPETLKRYKEDPIAFLEDDIKGWESEPDSDKKTKSLKNLKKNLKYLKSLKKK